MVSGASARKATVPPACLASASIQSGRLSIKRMTAGGATSCLEPGRSQADLVLPGATYAEKHGTYVNIEGRIQRSERAAFAPGDAREDWTIFRALSDLIGKPLPFDRFDQLRVAMIAEVPELGQDGIIDLPWSPPKLDAKASGPIGYPIKDFYLTNPICRASPTMRRCSEELVQGREYREAAE